MGTNNGNGTATRAKVELSLNQEIRLRLLKDKCYIGENSVGKYFLYSTVNTETGEEMAFFAPQEIHDIIVEKHLSKDSEFILKKIPCQNGSKKISSKLELSLVSSSLPTPPSNTDSLKETMLQCVRDAVSIVNEVKDEVAFRAEDLRSLSLTLFIARTKLGNGFH